MTGYSYGGLFSLYVLFSHPDTFDGYFAGSPSLDYDEGVLFTYEDQYAQQHDDMQLRLFMTSGSQEEGLADVEDMASRLRGRGYPGLQMGVSILAGGTHVTAIPQAWTEALLFLMGREEPRMGRAAPARPLEEHEG